MNIFFLLALSICKKEEEARAQGASAAADSAGVCSNGRHVRI